MMIRLLIFLLAAMSARAASPPVELGGVRWLRNLDAGLIRAANIHRPVLILFQEVPGCRTCQAYGADILTHPLIVEAIEDLFVPVAVFNNRGGTDRAALNRFQEPAWNNPVVRIVDEHGAALAERVSGDYTPLGLIRAMTEALEKTGQEIPEYVNMLQAEFLAESRGTDRAVFAMACFWSGESRLGTIEGVVGTRPGFLHGEEVVEVHYDPQVVAFRDLVRLAKTHHCTRKVFTRSADQQHIAQELAGDDAQPSDSAIRADRQPKFHLANSSYRYLPMTRMQAARVNGAIGRRTDPDRFLSPRQREMLTMIERHPQRGWIQRVGASDLRKAWQQVWGTQMARQTGLPNRPASQ